MLWLLPLLIGLILLALKLVKRKQHCKKDRSYVSYPEKGMCDPSVILLDGTHTIRAMRLPAKFCGSRYQIYEARINI